MRQQTSREGAVCPLLAFFRYVIEFVLCGFCGWLYEEGLELAVNHAYADRGLLHLPVLPIYGFGGRLLVWLFRKHKHPVFVFLVSTLVTTVLELAASYPIERFVGYLPWDYSTWFCNFEGRISLPSSLLFGGLALLLVNVVHPACDALARRLPKAALYAIGAVVLAVMVGDLGLVLLGR